MEAKKLLQKTSKQGAAPQTARGAPFCLRLNTLRALASMSVIVTHIMPFINLHPKFRSLHLAGHMGVYMFFALSGYLLTLSLVKEIRRRLGLDKVQNKTPVNPKISENEEAKRLSETQQVPQIQIDNGEKKEEIGEPRSPSTVVESPLPEATLVKKESKSKNTEFWSLSAWVKWAQQYVLVCVMSKFIWNRTWRIFPLFYACCSFLKIADIEGATWHPEPMVDWTWRDIYVLRQFPNHLWSMSIEMKFAYYVIPIYICILYVGFKLQQKGYNMLSNAVFSALVAVLIFLGIHGILSADPISRPVFYPKEFFYNLPPFCFGMLAGLLNFVLEQEFNRRQAIAKAKAQAQAQAQKEQEEPIEKETEKPSKSFKGKALQLLKGIAKYALYLLTQ